MRAADFTRCVREEIDDDAIAGLVGLGWTKTQARARVRRARERLAEAGEEPVDVSTLIAEAVRG